jgi:hypothetical protein
MRYSCLATVAFAFLSQNAFAVTESVGRAIQTEIRSMVPTFNARTGIALSPDSVHVHFDGVPLSGELAGEPGRVNDPARDLFATSSAVGDDGTGAWQDDQAGGHCLIVFSDAGAALTGVARTSIFAHELFHCYQHAAAAPVGLAGVGRWMTEGQAEWAGEMHATDATRSSYWLTEFLNTGSLSLFSRDYDAMPFFAHIYNRLGDVIWRRMIQMIRAATDTAAFNQAIYMPAELDTLQTWPMGLWMDETKGPDWVTTVPGNPAVFTEYSRESLQAGDVREIEAATPQHFTVRLRENKMYRIRLNRAHGGLSTDTVTGTTISQRLTEGDSQVFCFSSEFECRCPGGQRPSNEYTQLGRDAIDVAITSESSGLGRIEIEEFEPTCCGSEGTLPPEFVGTWELDVNAYARIAMGADTSSCAVSGTGYQTMRIDSRGGVTRSTAVTSTRVCTVGTRMLTSSEVTRGSSTMCMRVGTTAGGPTAFYTVSSDTHMTDFIQSDGRITQPYNEDGPAEAPSIAPYVGRWGDGRELRGSYTLGVDELVLRSSSTAPLSGARRLYTRTSR